MRPASHYTPRRLLALALSLLLLCPPVACARASGDEDYFPLIEGSRWEYAGTFRSGGRSMPLRAVARVEGSILIRGREYVKYVITPEWVGAPNLPKLTERVRYYRVAKEGVYLLSRLDLQGPELLELSLPIRPGVKWLDGPVEAEAQRVGAVRAGGKEYGDCIGVTYREPGGRPVVTEYKLAPGVGIVWGVFAVSEEPRSVMELTLQSYKR